jgi:hypothetical protein
MIESLSAGMKDCAEELRSLENRTLELNTQSKAIRGADASGGADTVTEDRSSSGLAEIEGRGTFDQDVVMESDGTDTAIEHGTLPQMTMMRWTPNSQARLQAVHQVVSPPTTAFAFNLDVHSDILTL